ncbi:DNA replication/repair protein RecF [Aneurinibacillus aneurinilyticus]|uniref:DNA replication and repair protein RecF n=1 Tax=Aneurinibacillus aneurinilyticus ATCC 12856 TaxID=649747 RepID=U1XY04_ANEAE|nr:DNA replication/repair protein RecF [Aneurinibacillus aneurinilyticus]ERI04877.1 DNA replication and repair protein RecF [Aneurinibacillus aneurinilyticus ATCC 12856]MED0705990.1 DNA replication/repair protein RecF [Aneurinibacillus aneurinilyticus]MED0721671.1 DNA replication/repair protein RecF [Aneurinibacillus aneurinilyticus]MED0730910.1 DNA replication/repair protein RecF [Aneurinibacillus aneurinilyticus]MED0742903.1 DNA replication/repair protein RecF [Aneurinibacillus aneurinilytic
MILKELELTQYRNFDHVHVHFDAPIVLFVGPNAQGKTNMLESIYVLAMAKSHRTGKDKELIQWNAPFARLSCRADRQIGPIHLDIQLTSKGKKAKVNQLEQRRLSDYIGAMNVVMFAPEDLSIVKGSPNVRRRFLDMEIGQVSKSYLYHTLQYQKLVHQRNQAMKELQMGKPFGDMLDIYNVQLAQLAAKVLHKRFIFMDKLEKWGQEIHAQITEGKETLTLSYESTLPVTAEMSESEAEEATYRHLTSIKDREIARGTSLAGPHRDDIHFFVNGISVHQYGSQGQQRTTALSLKLAEIELIHQEVGEYPLLLLDDVLSELDANRQSHLLQNIKDRVQTFVTTTGVEGLYHQTLQQAAIYRVKQGTITRDT